VPAPGESGLGNDGLGDDDAAANPNRSPSVIHRAACALILVLVAAALPARAFDQGPPAPLDPDRPVTRIAFGSCLDEEGPFGILDAVRAIAPDLFVAMGDNVYGDVVDGRRVEGDLMGNLERAYAELGAAPEFQALWREVPILATWDDHDYGVNDAGADFGRRDEAEALFERFWQIPPDAARGRRPGVYGAVTLGPEGRRVQIVLLDTRYFRSPLKPTDRRGAPGKERYVPDPDPAKTMLGEAQWAWLEERLREPAELRLIVSSIQVIAEGHGFERWGNLPLERERLYGLIDRTGAEGVMILSGDRHLGAFYRLDGERVPYPLWELTSSSLNLPLPFTGDEPGPHKLGHVYREANFGTLEIDWETGTILLALHDKDGAVHEAKRIPMDELRVE